MIKDRGKTNICCYAWYILYWPNPPDVVGAVTPVASEVISLLLVRTLQYFFLIMITTMTVVVIIIWWGSSFSLWSDWDAWTDGSDSMSEEMSVYLNERKENDDDSDYWERVCLFIYLSILFIYLFIYFVSEQIFWVAVLFCLNAWGLELCVVFGCLCILVVLSYVCSFHLQMRGNPVCYVRGLLLA